jgi:5'(3')-deoxyribonucleotidase
MQKIAIDMDGVLADVYSQFIKMHQQEFGELISIESIYGKTEGEAFVHCRKYIQADGFFRDAPLMEGCKKVLERINQEYDLYLVSAALEFPWSLIQKVDWIKQHFPFIGWQQIVLCGSKQIIAADIMIDDHFKNLDHFPGKTILFTQAHNILKDAGRHQRVNNWNEIEKILL